MDVAHLASTSSITTDPTLNVSMSLLEHHCSVALELYNNCFTETGSQTHCTSHHDALLQCVKPVVFQTVAVKRLCGDLENRAIHCVQKWGDALCELQLTALHRCVEAKANPRARYCLQAGIPVKDV
jgi:hypothetical protein